VCADASHDGSLTSRFWSGQEVMVFGLPVYWHSMRQSTVATFAFAAEYFAASPEADSAVYFKQFYGILATVLIVYHYFVTAQVLET
jgi:hypothetical protein